MTLHRPTVDKIDGKPLFPGHLEITHRFSDLAVFPVVEVSVAKLQELLQNHVEADGIEGSRMQHERSKLSGVEVARRYSGQPVPMPWITLGTSAPHCFIAGFDPEVAPMSRPTTEVDLLWPNREHVFALVRGGEELVKVLDAVGQTTIRVQVPYQQKGLLEALCGVEAGATAAYGASAANEQFRPCPVVDLHHK